MKKARIAGEELEKVDDIFISLYRYALYKDIQEYFNCSKVQAKNLWQKGIIKAIEFGTYRGYQYPIFPLERHN